MKVRTRQAILNELQALGVLAAAEDIQLQFAEGTYLTHATKRPACETSLFAQKDFISLLS